MKRNFLTDLQKQQIWVILERQRLNAWGVYERLKKHPGLVGTAGRYITQKQVAGYIQMSGLFEKKGDLWGLKPVVTEVSPRLSAHFSAGKYD